MLRNEVEEGELDDEDDVIPNNFLNIPRSGPLPDSDSDDDFPRRIFEKPKPVLLTTQDNEEMEVPTKRRRCKTRNNIWSNVVADQMLSGDLTNWSGVEETKSRDRDVESYDFSRAKEDARPECLFQEMLYSDRIDRPNDSVNNFDPDAIETFGSAGEGPKGIKRRLGNQVVKGIKTRLGERVGSDRRRVRLETTMTENSADEAVVKELMRLLEEPDSMKTTFKNVVSTIGVARSLEILRMTDEVEEDGGILTLDGTRQRSPGGVYLYLLKSKTTPEERKLIFPINGDFRHKRKAFGRKNRENFTERLWELPQDKCRNLDEKIDSLLERSRTHIANKNSELNDKNIPSDAMDINVTVLNGGRLVKATKMDDVDKPDNSNLDIDLDFI